MELHRKSEFSEFHKLLLRDFTLQRRSYYLLIPLGLIDEHEHELNEEAGGSNGIGIGIGMNGGNGNGSNSGNGGNPGTPNGFFGFYSPFKGTTSRTKWDRSPSITARHKKASKQDATSLNSSSSNTGLNIRLNMDLRFLPPFPSPCRSQRHSQRFSLRLRESGSVRSPSRQPSPGSSLQEQQGVLPLASLLHPSPIIRDESHQRDLDAYRRGRPILDVSTFPRFEGRVLTSSDRSEFYCVHLQIFKSRFKANIFSNTSPHTYYFPFLQFYHEFCNALLLYQLYSLTSPSLTPPSVLSPSSPAPLVTLRHLRELSSHLFRPVTVCSLSHVIAPIAKKDAIPPLSCTLSVLHEHHTRLGIPFFEAADALRSHQFHNV